MNKRTKIGAIIAASVAFSGVAASPVFAFEIPGVSLPNSNIEIPTVPVVSAPSLPANMPSGMPLPVSGIGSTSGEINLPGGVRVGRDGVRAGNVRVGRDGDVRVGDMRISSTTGVQVGDMRVAPGDIRVGDVRVSSTTGVTAGGVRVRPDGEVRVNGMRVSTTTVRVGNVRVDADGVRVGDMRISTSSIGIREDQRRHEATTSPDGAPRRDIAFKIGTTTEDGRPLAFGKASDFANNLKDKAAAHISSVKQQADTEIAHRIDALRALQDKIAQMTQLSDADKSSLTQELATQITALSNLKGTILNDTSTTTLKSDVQSITRSFRTFALTIPKGAIIAAAGRIDSVTMDMQTIGAKLKTLIDNAAAAGRDVSAAQAVYTEYVAKIDDAQAQADAARAGVENLVADNGDNTVYQNNMTAIQAAQKKIQLANSDLKDARNDITKIRKALPATSTSSSSTASTTSSTGGGAVQQ